MSDHSAGTGPHDLPPGLMALGIVESFSDERDAQECVNDAKQSIDLLLHHGSRFIGKGSTRNDWFEEALQRLKIRMLVQRPTTTEISAFRDLSARFPEFEYAFYSGKPLLRVVNIDHGRVCYLSHYANQEANRNPGSRSGVPSPQLRLVNTEQASLTFLAERLFDELWHRGVKP